MAINAGSPYEIPNPEDIEDPDFTYETDDKDEELYALSFLGTLSLLFTKYKSKGTDYAINNVEKDVSNLRNTLTKGVDKLQNIFDKVASETMEKAGILKDNLSKVDLGETITTSINTAKSSLKSIFKSGSKLIANGIEEQKSTIKGITEELSNNIKSKAHFLKNRNSEKAFDVRSNFDRATKRLKQMIDAGYNTTVSKAERHAQIFLYGDPDAYWITRNDSRVCPWCMAIQDASPMPLSRLPYCPLHYRCRCKIKLAKDLNMTEEAVKLTHYQIGV